MSSIGSLTFIKMKGPQIPALASFVRPINRPGIDGEAFREEAYKVQEIQLTTSMVVADNSTAILAVDSYSLYKGELATIIDDNGRTVENVMVLDVFGVMVVPLLASAPAGYSYHITANWLVKPTE